MLTASEVINKVREAMVGFEDCNILVGLSGGADSVTLTHALKTLGFSVFCAHVNHLLRGDEADCDEAFCKDFCKKLGIKLFSVRKDIKALAEEAGIGLEDAGRRFRYEFFDSISLENKIIATAHNKNDNAETILLHLVRGSGGLKGIPKREGIVRPLIDVSRAEIENYCKEFGLLYRVDSSNLCDEYTRNKIRHNILPSLEEINPNISDALIRAAEVSGGEHSVVEALACEEEVEFSENRVACKQIPTQKPILIELIKRMYKMVYGSEANLSYKTLNASAELVLSGKTGKRADLFDGIFLETSYSSFFVGKEAEEREFRYLLEDSLKIPEAGIEVTLGQGELKLDGDKLGKIYLRSRQNGDRVFYKGHLKKLKDVLIDNKVPKDLRSKVVVLEADGVCLGALGYGIIPNFTANEETKNIISIDWRIDNGKHD